MDPENQSEDRSYSKAKRVLYFNGYAPTWIELNLKAWGKAQKETTHIELKIWKRELVSHSKLLFAIASTTHVLYTEIK